MRVAKLTAAQGLAWIPAGWRLFRLQPINYTTLLATYIFVLLVAMLGADLLGQWASAVLPETAARFIAEAANVFLLAFIPGLSIGFIEASRTALQGSPIYPTVLIKAFRIDRRTTFTLFALGLLQIGLILAVSYLVVAPKPLTAAVDANGNFDLTKVPPAEAFDYLTASVVNVLATLPVYLAFWYAPVLIAWHRMPVFKALFFSTAAVWRNLSAFLAYGLGWFVAATAALAGAGIVLNLLGLGSGALVVGIPLMLVIVSVVYCSIYPSYSTVFVDSGVVPQTPP